MKLSSTILSLSISSLMFACTGNKPMSIQEQQNLIISEINNISFGDTDTAPTDVLVDIDRPMREVIRSAVAQNPAFLAASARSLEAYANIEGARAALRPQASVSARGGQLRENGNPGQTYSGIYGNLTVSQLLGDGGGSVAAVDLATARALLSEINLRTVGNQVAAAAATSWVELWLAQSKFDLLEQRTQALSETITQLERMASNGLVDAGTLDSARRQAVELRLERQQLVRALSAAKINFARYYGAAPDSQLSWKVPFTNEEVFEVATLWENSPELNRLGGELLVARANLRQAEAAFAPSTRLQSSMNSPIDDADPTSTSVGIVLEYTIGSGGRRQANLTAAQQQVEAAYQSLVEANDNVRTRTQTLASELRTALSSIDLAEERVRIATAEVEASRSQLLTGQSNLRALFTAEVTSYRASDNLLDLRARVAKLGISLAEITGALHSGVLSVEGNEANNSQGNGQ